MEMRRDQGLAEAIMSGAVGNAGAADPGSLDTSNFSHHITMLKPGYTF
jgi:hypothetical protein